MSRKPKPWAIQDDAAAMTSAVLISEIAQKTGQSLQEAAEGLAHLEEMGLARREPDGTLTLLNPKGRPKGP
jgi:DNA-binding IclR family transcriptional regulator